jgi:hypothetical protein
MGLGATTMEEVTACINRGRRNCLVRDENCTAEEVITGLFYNIVIKG